MTPRILVLAGSNRAGAFSGKVADAAVKTLALGGVLTTRILLADYPIPLMDEDLEREKGIPQNAQKLAALFHEHHAIVFATPEYNGSIPPLLKNVIDWVSRVSRVDGRAVSPYSGKPVAICSSSSGHFAGIRAANHLRAILSHVGCEVIAPQCSVPNAASAFGEDGELSAQAARAAMERMCAALAARAALVTENRT
jgi:chromate reductase